MVTCGCLGPARSSPPGDDSAPGTALAAPGAVSSSGDVVPVEVHHLDPRRHEVLDELLLRVIAGVDLRDRTQLGVRAEHEVGTAAGPPDLTGGRVATFEGVLRVRGRVPGGAHVEQVRE